MTKYLMETTGEVKSPFPTVSEVLVHYDEESMGK